MKPTPRMLRRLSGRTVHRVLGALSLAVGVLLGITGALLALGSAVTRPATVAPAAARPPLAGLDAAAARVEEVARGARVVAMIAEPDGSIRVDVRRAGGEPARVRIARAGDAVTVMPAASTAWDVVRRLHAGDFAGWLSRALYAAVGVALAVLAMTGFVIAVRRQSSKVLM